MNMRMLIDARHQEETRVAVLKGNRIEEFDFEAADCKQIKGNIYLAKVTRVEPSLQAAFVDFGGNRHGFLAFSEIHPDYYQIPKADRDQLLAEEAEHAAEEAALRALDEQEDEDFAEDNDDDNLEGQLSDDASSDDTNDDDNEEVEAANIEPSDDATVMDAASDAEFSEHSEDSSESADVENSEPSENNERRQGRHGRRRQGNNRSRSKEADEVRAKRMALRRRYKIQDVIHRRQVLLVQVVKEERGNKGAALTTYLSLAGRYCVLMPNSSHGGGISRKINSAADRKRLKGIIEEMNLPQSMGCIVRTAGLARTKTEIRRDFDYLARLWDDIREATMRAAAPSQIHSDSDLIKRAIRDIYNRDIAEVIVEGEYGYRAARDFMKLLMPSHVRRVKAYSDPVPLFQRFGAEDQLLAMYDPVVQLKSGGYLVINPTEALVSIDINSGRSTKEHGIEATALNTNLEAAYEIARQLRLRDMAGLVVIDFIDMEYGSNIRKVEKALKDALKNDRARIQVGRISSFGLMEMSRQRLRTGVLEATTRTCPHCDGSGLVRTASSSGLSALRLIEDEAARGRGIIISLFASTEAAIYLLNAKRSALAEIEHLYRVRVEVIPEGENEGAKMRVISSGPANHYVPRFNPIPMIIEEDDLSDSEFDEELEEESAESDPRDENGENRRRRRRRRNRNRNRREDGPSETDEATSSDDLQSEALETPANADRSPENNADESAENVIAAEGEETSENTASETPSARRRRRRRRNGARTESTSQESDENAPSDNHDAPSEEAPAPEITTELPANTVAEVLLLTEEVGTQKPEEPTDPEGIQSPSDNPIAAESDEIATAKPKRTRRKKTDDAPSEEKTPKRRTRTSTKTNSPEAPTESSEEAEGAAAEEPPVKPKRTRRKKADALPAAESAEAPAAEATADTPPVKPKRTRRKKVEPAEANVTDADVAHTEAPTASPAAESPSAPIEAESTSKSENDSDANDQPRRTGWWQRTFGN